MVVVGALAVFLLSTVVTADPVQVTERSPSIGWEPPDVQPPVDEPVGYVPNEPDPIAPAEGIAVDEAMEIVTSVFQILAFLAIAVAALFLARRSWERRADRRGSGGTDTDGFATLVEVADAIVADAESQRVALGEGSARNAIVACWLRLEASVQAAGVEPDPALTSTELTTEVLHRFALDAGAVEELGSLYREARFSTHQLGEQQRTAAIDALDAVHAGLRRVVRSSEMASPASTAAT